MIDGVGLILIGTLGVIASIRGIVWVFRDQYRRGWHDGRADLLRENNRAWTTSRA